MRSRPRSASAEYWVDGQSRVWRVRVATAANRFSQALPQASWLTGQNRQLDGARPIDLLGAGRTEHVLRLARQFAADASG